MPKVSIIMPSLNVVSYIDKCIRSAREQTLTDIEIICIDAGSTDGTKEILQRYANLDDRIKLYHSDVKSYGHQVNLGIRKAIGDYVAILETDDFTDPEMYEKLYLAAEKNHADYIRADYSEIFEANGKTIWNEKHLFSDTKNYNVVMRASGIPYMFAKDINIWSGIYRRVFLEGYNIRLNETAGAAFQDIGFKMLTLLYARKIIYIDYSGYRYRFEREGCSSCNNNVLKFAWQEFDRLINKLNLSDNDRFQYLILRMIDVFICEHNKLVIKQASEQQLNEFYEMYIEPYYLWFKEEIDKFLSEGMISLDDLSEYQRGNLLPLLENERDYNLALVQAEKKKTKCWDEVAAGIKNAQAVIVSYGARGKAALRQLIDRNVNVVAICDNDVEVRKQKVGIPVLSVEDAIAKYEKARFVISNKKYGNELEQQLIANGVCGQNIIQIDS